MPEPELQAPTAAFTADEQSGEAPLTVVFTNTSTGTIVGYAWSFGDGESSSDKEPTHIFTNPGNYAVSLTVFNEKGSTTVVYRIDVSAPDEVTPPALAETVGDLIPSIRASLRRPSDAKLHYRDVLDVINDLLRGYSRDLHVSEQDHRTDEAQCVFNHLDGSDYLLTIDGVSEVEPMELKYVPSAELRTDPQSQAWREMTIVPLDYYSERHQRDAAVCSFFAGLVLANGVKVKINLDQDTIEQSVWKIRYRVPLLRLLTLTAKTPLPADFIPMLKLEAVLMCLPRMRDDSKEFYAWRKANEPIFMGMVAAWRGRWKDFLDTNTEPNYAPKTSANDYRRQRTRPSRYTIERG
jgi:PKD domain